MSELPKGFVSLKPEVPEGFIPLASNPASPDALPVSVPMTPQQAASALGNLLPLAMSSGMSGATGVALRAAPWLVRLLAGTAASTAGAGLGVAGNAGVRAMTGEPQYTAKEAAGAIATQGLLPELAGHGMSGALSLLARPLMRGSIRGAGEALSAFPTIRPGEVAETMLRERLPVTGGGAARAAAKRAASSAELGTALSNAEAAGTRVGLEDVAKDFAAKLEEEAGRPLTPEQMNAAYTLVQDKANALFRGRNYGVLPAKQWPLTPRDAKLLKQAAQNEVSWIKTGKGLPGSPMPELERSVATSTQEALRPLPGVNPERPTVGAIERRTQGLMSARAVIENLLRKDTPGRIPGVPAIVAASMPAWMRGRALLSRGALLATEPWTQFGAAQAPRAALAATEVPPAISAAASALRQHGLRKANGSGKEGSR